MPDDGCNNQTRDSDRIILSGIILRGHHGVSEAERELIQRFRIDLILELDLSEPGQSDDLVDAVDYSQVFEAVRDIVQDRSFSLLEAMATCIADTILAGFAPVHAVRVGVFKPDPPLNGTFDRVGVEIWRERE